MPVIERPDTARISWESDGPEDAPAVLLLMGLAYPAAMWFRLVPALAESYRVIRIDNRGAGRTGDVPGAPYTVETMAADSLAVLDAADVHTAHIVGISMGGFMSLELALRHPVLVRSLVLVATSAGGRGHKRPSLATMRLLLARRQANADPGELARNVYAAIMGPGYAAGNPDVMERIAAIARYRPMTGAAYFRQLWVAMRHNVAARLGQIRVPTLVIHGADDPLVPPINGQRLARRIPGARLIIYPNTGHIPIIERAAEFNRDVLAFLAEQHPPAER